MSQNKLLNEYGLPYNYNGVNHLFYIFEHLKR